MIVLGLGYADLMYTFHGNIRCLSNTNVSRMHNFKFNVDPQNRKTSCRNDEYHLSGKSTFETELSCLP